MRRYCTEEEKRVLVRNAGCFLTGSFEISRGNSKKANIIAGVIGCLIGIPLAVYLNIIFMDGHSSTYLSVLLVFAIMGGCEAIAHSITKRHAREHGNQEFAAEGIQSINGGTVVGINPINKTIYYIEDDINNFDGLPIVIDYPANDADLAGTRLGERVLIVYHPDNQFQLMHATQETIRLIPAMDSRFPLNLDPNAYKHVPHPNAINISVIPKKLDGALAQKFEEAWTRFYQKNTTKPIIIMMLVFIVLFGLIGIGVGVSERDAGTGLLIWGGFSAFFAFIFGMVLLCGKSGIKKQMKKTVEVREVIYHSSRIGYSRSLVLTMNVYEWENGSFQLKEYMLSNTELSKCKYGDIIYVLFDANGIYRMAIAKNEI